MKALALLLALGACGDNISPFDGIGLVRVTGATPPQIAKCHLGFADTEVEPMIAIDPNNPDHLIGAWQQDRNPNGAAAAIGTATSFDGGATWSVAYPHATICAGGDAANGGDFDRASDPWLAIGVDGTAYLTALAFDGARSVILAFRSDDGGASWSEPTLLRVDTDPDVFSDKSSVTADPTVPGRVYAVWDRLTGVTMPTKPVGTGPTWLARMTDGAWEPARPIFDPGIDAQTIGNIVVGMPDGALVIVTNIITQASSDNPTNTIAVIRSEDKGTTWSPPVTVATMQPIGVKDPNRDTFVRSGTDLPEVAVDRTSGALYIVWEDARFTFGQVDGIAMVTSRDGGKTWSPRPRQVNLSDAPAFEPMVAVADDGTIGVTFYDLRDGDPGDASSLTVTTWLATSSDHGATWTEEPLSRPFDLRPMEIGGSYFLGDYQGLVTSGTSFVPFFVGATATASDVFVRPVPR